MAGLAHGLGTVYVDATCAISAGRSGLALVPTDTVRCNSCHSSIGDELRMGENTAIYCSASSRRTAVCAAGHTKNIVTVWDAMGGRDKVAILEGTLYCVGSGHLAVSDSGELVAVGEYNRGVELWDWGSRRLVWRNSRVDRVQSVAFASEDQELLVGMDTGAAILAAADGAKVGSNIRINDAVASPFAPVLVGTRRKNIVICRRDSGAILTVGPRRSFGVLAAAFTPKAVVVSETDGSLRAFDLSNGGLIAEANGWFLALASVLDRERMTGWSNVRGEPWGELIQFDLAGATSRCVVKKEWQSALPIMSGTAWVFTEGTITKVDSGAFPEMGRSG